jgi:putative flavoprotein involved in K+ transport
VTRLSRIQSAVVIVGGGQSGLAAARSVQRAGLRPIVLEASTRAAGSWPDYYDSLAAFSPARHSAMPGAPFPGDPDHYPSRDEVAAYLERYAGSLGVEIRLRTRVAAVWAAGGGGFVVKTAEGEEFGAAAVIAASGSFSNPNRPRLAGQETFTGELLHVADYRNPGPYAGRRVVVVGAGNSAMQVAYELARVASVTLASHRPLQLVPQIVRGRDVHDWLTSTGFDDLPPAWLARLVTHPPVVDTGGYAEALEAGRPDRRPMFTGLEDRSVVWADGVREPVDVVLLATGYRPSLGYLGELGALDADGMPLHAGGVSTTHLGLGYVGLEFQRSFASNTLRGVSRDADHVVRPLAALARGAPETVLEAA